MADRDIEMIKIYAKAEKDALERARVDALVRWNGRGEIPMIVWDNLSTQDRQTIYEARADLRPDLGLLLNVGLALTFTLAVCGGVVGLAAWTATNGVAVGLVAGIISSAAFSAYSYIPYWRAPRGPGLGAALRWTAEELNIRTRARIEARGYQDGELTEVKRSGDLRVIDGGRS